MSTNFDDEINSALSKIDLDASSRDTALKQVVDVYSEIPDVFDVEHNIIANRILKFSQTVVTAHNANLDKSQAALKWQMPKDIEPFQIAICLLKAHHAISLSYVDETSKGDIAVYCEDGIQEGLYTTEIDYINAIIYSYHVGINKSGLEEVMSRLKSSADHRIRNENPDLIAVNNGIYNYRTKHLMPFDPDVVFVTKSRTSYNPNAQNVNITNSEDGTDWDVESWMDSLTDDPEIAHVLWEITGALLRPNVVWNKSAWLYSDLGENGKGTLCAMWRNLCGNAATSVPIADFSKNFMLSSLIKAQAIIVDENDVGTFIDKAGNLKAVITNDTIMIDRKFKEAIDFRFHGFMVQCLNELPRFKDKSDSIYRRQLFIPMTKCFTGVARTYIKSDYINRPDVLEYVMKRVFDMTYYSLSEPNACRMILNEYKIYNDPVRQFWCEFEDQFSWDILPYSFIYSLYKEWFKRDNPSGSIIGRNTFIKDLQNAVSKSDVFKIPDGNDKVRTSGRMDKTETLIATYNLLDWQTPGMTSKSSTIEAICKPLIADSYRGLVRIQSVAGNSQDGNDNDDNDDQNGTNNNVISITEKSNQNADIDTNISTATVDGSLNQQTNKGDIPISKSDDNVLKMPTKSVNDILAHTPAPAAHIEVPTPPINSNNSQNDASQSIKTTYVGNDSTRE